MIDGEKEQKPQRFRQLLKWIGNKHRFAEPIASFFPKKFNTYHEPFLGSGAVLGFLSPRTAEAADCLGPLITIWHAVKHEPQTVVNWYQERWNSMRAGGKISSYEAVKASYNAAANGADLLFLSRCCYGGAIRFRKRDGHMSTPCGIHDPLHPNEFSRRVSDWSARVAGTLFFHRCYEESLDRAREGDLVYCDPPYSYSQAILYGAQMFSLDELFRSIEKAKKRGVFVALSIDGSKKSGEQECRITWPYGLFARQESIYIGRSMLRRFQMPGRTLEAEIVRDRLLLTH
jgi:DNA adenine methylase